MSAVVASSALLNLVLIVLRQWAARLGARDAALYLGYDILQLAVLLYLTGGLQNPFAILILAPVTKRYQSEDCHDESACILRWEEPRVRDSAQRAAGPELHDLEDRQAGRAFVGVVR